MTKTDKYKETNLLGMIKLDPGELFSLPFWTSLVVTVIFIGYTFATEDYSIKVQLLKFSNDLIGISLSSLGLTLASLGFLFTIFERSFMAEMKRKKLLHKFLLPYYLSAMSWWILALISILYYLTKNLKYYPDLLTWIFSVLILFFLISSSLYTIRLVASIIRTTIQVA